MEHPECHSMASLRRSCIGLEHSVPTEQVLTRMDGRRSFFAIIVLTFVGPEFLTDDDHSLNELSFLIRGIRRRKQCILCRGNQ